MKKSFLIFIFIYCILAISSRSQPRLVDSLRQYLRVNNDTLQMVIARQLTIAYQEANHDSAIAFGNKYLSLAQKMGYRLHEAEALQRLADAGEQHISIQLDLLLRAERILVENSSGSIVPISYFRMLGIPFEINDKEQFRQYTQALVVIGFAATYWSSVKYDKAMPYAREALYLANQLKVPELLVSSNFIMGALQEDSDSAIVYLNKAAEVALNTGWARDLPLIYDFIAKAYDRMKNHSKQLSYLHLSMQEYLRQGLSISTGWGYLQLGEFYQRSMTDRDSSLFYLKKAYQTAVDVNFTPVIYYSSKDLYHWYKKSSDKDSILKYVTMMINAEELHLNQESQIEFEAADYRQEIEKSALEKANEQFQRKTRTYLLLGSLIVLSILALIFWRNSTRRQRQFIILQKQKAKTDEALQNLKSTQAQLVQSEKMASLGELTAGIAHEIQNPLNFVNNFSEVNDELLKELNAEAEKGNLEDVKSLAKDIASNSQKINHHGKRADAIVKGMLQHSRSSSGVKEPADINALADEYLRLAYHGLRAKDSSFNATIKTDFDKSISNINIIPQDIGRVILNLLTNAFYAVSEKANQNIQGYEPTVSISTKKTNSKVEIKVTDNGNGIPQNILDKIFQPFFTTKPTGQGTGLGLSLSYDIVKVHGGEIKAETKQGKGTTFILSLPVA